MTKCKHCGVIGTTYNQWCSPCLWQEMNYWHAQTTRANNRAAYWARMYDELTEIANTKLDDDEQNDD